LSGTPTSIALQALDAAGVDQEIGDIEDGTRPARVVLRAYRQCLMQLLRACHWDFARRQVPLVLLADATGNTPNVGTLVSNTEFLYCYQYPVDCMKVRFVPWNINQNPGAPAGNIVPANASSPLTTGTSQAPAIGRRLRPARFNVGTDFNYPPPAGQITWEVQGVSPQGRTVIYTNVKCAHLVYTALMLYPSVWDPQFRAAFVAYLASEIVLALHKDKKLALALRPTLIQSVKDKVTAARCTDGNEGVYGTSHIPDWVKSRATGGGGWPGGGGAGWGLGDGGSVWCGFDQLGFADGSCY
jgi:hypothetical protein